MTPKQKLLHKYQAAGVFIFGLGLLSNFMICHDIRCISYTRDVLVGWFFLIGLIVFIVSVWLEVKERGRIGFSEDE
ncbi:hypothetical protein KJ891_04750 [Candidatus Micrarchaeota archaeon]|nr:hypothetical protein [Candidatus Micrarchaeota archaeon]